MKDYCEFVCDNSVSIIIPVYNEEKYIEKCLLSVIEQTYTNIIEILVIDGNSNDETRNIVEGMRIQYPYIHLLNNPKRSTPAALNIGIKNAKGDFIVRLDSHAIYDKHYVERCCSNLILTRAYNVGGVQNVLAESPFQFAVALAYLSKFGIGGSSYLVAKSPCYVDTVWLGAFPRKIFSEVGLYDEWLIGGEDDELNYRIKCKGGKIYLDPKIKGYYYPRQNIKSLFKQFYGYGNGKGRSARKHKCPINIRQLIPPTFITTVVGLACFSPFYFEAKLVLVSEFILYLSLAIIYAGSACFKNRKFNLFFRLIAVFITLHISYGLGYLKAITQLSINREISSIQ